jgi:hypothetical protein
MSVGMGTHVLENGCRTRDEYCGVRWDHEKASEVCRTSDRVSYLRLTACAVLLAVYRAIFAAFAKAYKSCLLYAVPLLCVCLM